MDRDIYCHKPNVILPSAFSTLSCRYNWRFYSHELLHTQGANATYGNDEQAAILAEEDLVVCLAVVEEEASIMHA